MAYVLGTLRILRNISVRKFHTAPLCRLNTSLEPTICSTRQLSGRSDENPRTANYKIIYRFPYIRAARLIARVKLLQTGFTLFAIPPSVIGYVAGIVPAGWVVSVVFIGTFASAMLIVMSQMLQSVVGLLAVGDEIPYARISHLNFWGNRRDVYIPFDDFVLLSELSEDVADVYVKVRRYSSKDVFYLSLKYGLIENKEEMQRLLGNIFKE